MATPQYITVKTLEETTDAEKRKWLQDAQAQGLDPSHNYNDYKKMGGNLSGSGYTFKTVTKQVDTGDLINDAVQDQLKKILSG